MLHPHKIYCYKSLTSSLLLSSEFVHNCNHWRNRASSRFVRDLYDGKLWKQFLNVSGTPFLSDPFSYGLVLNIDWFQPYSHTVASVGVIYLAVMNLPRHLRYKRKNMLLLGIIPGPSEPKEINTFLLPLVEELKELKHVDEVMKCNTMTERAKKESKFGCRYSALLDLSYFDPPTMLPIDPMHNLFLGTGKRMISVWINTGILDGRKYEKIQQSVDGIVVPSDVGRIPRKTGFSGFKADQFKIWILLYSIPALFEVLPKEHLECWCHYVLACRILCKQQL